MKRYSSIILYFLILLLIALHGFQQIFIVDTTTVLLLVLLMLLPVIPFVQKVRYGDFEAEIKSQEIKELEKKADKAKKRQRKIDTDSSIPELRDLVEIDPTLALAKVRIELEKRLKTLTEIYLKERPTYVGLKGMIFELEKAKVIDSKFAIVLDDLVSVASRAIHGEEIAKDDALRLIEVSEGVMEELSFVIINRSHSSVKKTKIKKSDLERYEDGEYEVKTIIPYSRSPEIRTYTLTKDELDSFLSGYDEFVEFIIEVKRK